MIPQSAKTLMVKHAYKVAIIVAALLLASFLMVGCSSEPDETDASGQAEEVTVVETVDQGSDADEGNASSSPESQSASEAESSRSSAFSEQGSAAMDTVSLKINGTTYQLDLADNPTAKAFKQMLPVTLDMTELNGNEKYHNLSKPLPSNPQSIGKVEAGDVMLFQDDCIVIFYETFSTSYRYTRIGKIENPEGLAKVVGNGSVEVTFSE